MRLQKKLDMKKLVVTILRVLGRIYNQNDEGLKPNPIENVFYNYLKELMKKKEKLDNKEKKIRKN